jgi:signal peptidase I
MTAHHPAWRRTRRVARWSANLVIVLVIIGCAAWIVPSAFGYSRYVITGGSMTGTYDKGSVVFEKPVAADDLRVGDVITYMPPADSGVANLVTHRILKMQPAKGGGVLFTTQGDNNPDPDPWHFKLLSTHQPVVEHAVPHLGWAFIALADRETRMLLVGGPAALVGLLALVELVRALRERRRAARPAPATVVSLPPQRTPDAEVTLAGV